MIIYRYLTHADFFNINKPPGSEERGGGQSYVDFSTQRVERVDWDELFSGVKDVSKTNGKNGPKWEFPIYSIGFSPTGQKAQIFQRRPASIVVARQKLDTRDSNRIEAWSPAKGFPVPRDRNARSECPVGLVVFFARLQGRIWAGWFINQHAASQPMVCKELQKLIGPLIMPVPGSSERQREGTLKSRDATKSLEGLLERLDPKSGMGGDSPWMRAGFKYRDEADSAAISDAYQLDEDVDNSVTPSYSIVEVRKRNIKSVQKLKALYGNSCQLTGKRFVFPKADGVDYTEVHHLIPLGKGGADSPSNMVVISAHMHRMLHYADVKGIDLDKIKKTRDGGLTLDLTINGKKFTMRWNKAHGKIVSNSQK